MFGNSSAILVALAIPPGQLGHNLAGSSDFQEVIPSTRPSSWSEFQELLEGSTWEAEESRRRSTGARALSWIRRQLLGCTNPSMADAHEPLAEHQAATIEQRAAYIWQVTILVEGKGWFLALYHQNDLPIQYRQAVASAVPCPDLPTFISDRLKVSYEGIIRKFQDIPADSAGDGWRTTFMEIANDWSVVLIDRTNLVDTYIESKGFFNRQRRQLEEAERAFDSNTITSGYIPFNERHKLHTETEHGTVSLDQASQLLATTAASQPGKRDQVNSYYYDDGDLIFRSTLKGIQDQKTAACSHQDEPTNQDRDTESPNGSSTANPPNHYKYSHVIVGKEDQNECVVCGEQFKYPFNEAKDYWRISEVTRIKKCRHDFHPKCIRPWIIKHNNRSCPLCRVRLDDDA
ncbi:hypothetical protein PTTG_26570 [Puccinia triticina 1-1 BBBD Race 1]|uniref:RING-type E3 ubiquitin transferase n=1 Tax=Puccinia triticina (isolate 1-1 / race 1 (BBBD)) TaxID=630390 RepID=A0A180GSK0_PUCT1|nr:hypothetical protein PTTG_26570 [Puccinia triticina 1-1 BBBD Race 1]WAR62123.1 hypothetical protein PtB15_14B217 [Puccinia triticina]